MLPPTPSITPLPLVPGDALGPFRLGSLLFNVLNHVRSFRTDYPRVRIAWDQQTPATTPLHLALAAPPLDLTFDPLSQRLSRIIVHGPDPAAWVTYRGQRLRPHPDDPDQLHLDDPDQQDVVKTLRRVLGPTYGSSTTHGDRATPEEEEMFTYPGVAFGIVRTASGSTMSRIVITALPAPADLPIDQAWLHPVLPESPAIAHGDLRLAEIHLGTSRRPTHTTLHFHSARKSAQGVTSIIPPVELRIGETTSEDLLCDLGPAIRTFWKEDDRLSIHTASLSSEHGAEDAALEPNPYFLSYPHLGLTLLVSSSPSSSSTASSPSLTINGPRPSTDAGAGADADGVSDGATPAHTLRKIVLHSNVPGQVQFGRTARARSRVVVAGGDGQGNRTGISAHDKAQRPRGETPAGRPDGLSVGVEEGWAAVRKLLLARGRPNRPRTAGSSDGGGGDAGGVEADLDRPMILDRTANESRGGVRGETTEIYGFPGLAVEVTQAGDIETLWLF